MKNFLDERVLNLARASDDGDGELRAALTVSSILGRSLLDAQSRDEEFGQVTGVVARVAARPNAEIPDTAE
jgi:hypothetical protein